MPREEGVLPTDGVRNAQWTLVEESKKQAPIFFLSKKKRIAGGWWYIFNQKLTINSTDDEN